MFKVKQYFKFVVNHYKASLAKHNIKDKEICVASRRLSTVLNDSFYLTIIAGSVEVQNLNYRVVLVSERQILIQIKEIHLPSGVSQFF